ncbi:MAG TPA: aldehyde dehydrogenase family protein [Anaerovoracaceae bacterium]|nr:aldehyde dehydrogenase family protein [Anaerovoracaceae bacterium]
MKMIIGGKKVDSKDGAVIQVINPATQELIDTVPSAAEEDIEKCLEIAQQGKKVWAGTPLPERARILLKYADVIEAHKAELAELACRELGKPISEFEGEIGEAVKIIRGFVERANHLYGEVIPLDMGGSDQDIIFTRHEPLGVIACIVPFNYPIMLYAFKIAPALIMGNAAVVKPATDNPLAVIRLVELLLECGVPEAAVQVVTGRGSTLGKLITSSSKIDAVAMTGSTEVGIDILKASALPMHRVFLELGGNDAMIVYEDADMGLAVNEVYAMRTFNAGQTCCAPKRFLVQNPIKEEFTKRLIEKLTKVVAGNPLDRDTVFGCLVSEKAAIAVEKQIKLTVEQGAKLIYGGKRDRAFFQPAVLTDVTGDMDIAVDMEVFGAVFPIIGFDTTEEALRIANASQYGLCGGVISSDVNKAVKTASQLEAGTVVINGSGFYRTADMAFGGYKMSGLGREGISCTLEEMSQIKTYVLKGILK